MKKASPQYQRNSLSQGQFNISLNRLLLCDSVSRLLITTVQFVLYWLVLGTMMTNTDHRIEDRQSFIFDEILSLLEGYVLSSHIPSEFVAFGDLLTPQEE